MSSRGGGFARLEVAFESAFAAAVALTLLPLLAAHYLPIQDLPQHTAAVRVLHDFSDPGLGFARFFERSLGSTQYLSVYLLADALAYVFGAVWAVKLVIALSIGGLPYAVRSLLRALGRPESYAVLILPFAYNTQLILGFLNFVAGLPLMIWGLALSVRLRASGGRRLSWLLAGVAVLCFFTHVVPFGFLALGAALVALEREPRRVIPRLLPLAPALVCASIWLATAPAGRALLDLGRGRGPEPEWPALGARLSELPFWLMDVLPGGSDDFVLTGAAALALFLLGVGSLARGTSKGPLLPRFWALGGLAALGYLCLPASYGFIWPINGRFALLTLLFVLVSLPRAGFRVRALAAALGLSLALGNAAALFAAFRASAAETRGLGELVAEVPRGSRVLGLIFDPRSRHLNFSPYLHAVAWVQAERGGAVMFTFADFPASPFRFKEDARPPRVPPRWEWLPERVDTRRLPAFYEYVLTRAARLPLAGLTLVDRRGDWALLRRGD